MQDLNKPQMTEPQEQASENKTTDYMRPKIDMYKEKDLLKMVGVFGCSCQAPGGC